MSTLDLRELSSNEEVCEAFPIVAELRNHLDAARYLKLYERMSEDGYWLFAADDGVPVAVARVMISTNFYLDRYAYVYDLVTTDKERLKGHGHGCSSTSANGPPIATAKPSNSRRG